MNKCARSNSVLHYLRTYKCITKPYDNASITCISPGTFYIRTCVSSYNAAHRYFGRYMYVKLTHCTLAIPRACWLQPMQRSTLYISLQLYFLACIYGNSMCRTVCIVT